MSPTENEFAERSLELADQLLVNLLYRYSSHTVSGAQALARANAHAVGVGEKITGGKPTGRLALRIHVIQKLPPALIPPDAMLPREFRDIPTDVIESPVSFRQPGAMTKPLRRMDLPHCSMCAGFRQRPVVPGISMASEKVTGGTLGCFCKSTRESEAGQRFALTTGHVLGSQEGGESGDVVLQPAAGDFGQLTDRIGTVARFTRIDRGRHAKNRVDGGIVQIDPEIEIDTSICMIGKLTGTRAPERHMKVLKHGRSTHLTEGVITDYPIHTVVTLSHSDLTLVARFNNQIRVRSNDRLQFADRGDSGSIIVLKETLEAIGLFFAAPDSGDFGFANPIKDVFEVLGVDLL